jgi:TolA-binding protein
VSVVGLHPEELFDKEARNALSDSERVRLDAHVAQCSACRVERQMRADFADEMAGDEARISVSALLAFAKIEKQDRALASGDHVHSHGASDARVAKAPRRSMVKATWLLAAAAVFAVSIAGATGVGQRAWSTIVEASAPVATAPVVAKAALKHVAHHASPAPIVAPEPSVDVLAASAPIAAPVAVHAPVHVAPRALEGAAALFDSATDARRHGDYARALTLHRELQSRFPNSREAHVARATAGRLLLDLGDPAGALASFDEYLASGSGELGEETMVGRATALERLGRADEARRAWQALLAAYPDSPYAAHAMRRLGSQSVH